MPALNLLTAARIAAEKPGDKPRKVADGGGLFMLIQPNGARWWRFKYRVPAGERLLSLGTFPAVSLSLAREKAAGLRELLAQGLDPSEVRKARKADRKAALEETSEAADRAARAAAGQTIPGTFKALAEEFVKVRGANWSPRYVDKVDWALRAWLYPTLADKPIAAVTAPALLDALRKPEAQGKLEAAHKARNVAGAVMRYGIATGQADADPSAALRGALRTQRHKHMAFPTDPAMIGAMMRAIRDYPGTPTVYAALRITPYVFVRPGELRAAEWAEFDLDASVPMWTIPAERMKARRIHKVPLAWQVVEVLRELRHLTGGGRFVFPSVRTDARCMSENTVAAALRMLGYGGDLICPHGFRHMASTLLNEAGWSGDVIELQLAHADRNAIRAVYNKAERLPERAKMMQAYADHLDRLRDGRGHVIPFRRGAA